MANITAHWSPGPQVLVEFYSSMLSFLCDCFQSGQSLLFLSFPVHAVTSLPVLSSSPPFCPLNLWALKFLFVPSHRLSLHLLSMFFHLFG